MSLTNFSASRSLLSVRFKKSAKTKNVNDDAKLEAEFNRMIKIQDTTAILLQPMLSGTEIFIGAKKRGQLWNVGHVRSWRYIH